MQQPHKPRPCILYPIFFILVLAAISSPVHADLQQFTLSGKTMGTRYTVKFISDRKESMAQWKQTVAARLKTVNQHLSMFSPNSELSVFNRYPAGQPFTLSTDFYKILVQCQRLYQLTHGAWDGTVKPLVDLWGFGTRGKTWTQPDPAAIQAALAQVGFARLHLSPGHLTKQVPGITLDLGSIAKGYGVDALTRLLAQKGIHRFLVEIGGELAGAGTNLKGIPWQVGITRPVKGSLTPGLFRVVSLKDRAIATSGNYRNYFEKGGQLFSHIIDPETGYPVGNRIVSASVIAPDCTFADGLATALMVMDVEKGLALVNRLDQVECLIIQKGKEQFIPRRSTGFKALEQP
jgi:thiamine biosynthesis lipoprotein